MSNNLCRYANKGYKQSTEGRYWKKFQNVLMERDQSAMQIADVAFCHGQAASNLMALAVSARVDLYRLK